MTNRKIKTIEILKKSNEAMSPKDMLDKIDISRSLLQRYLKELEENRVIEKIGKGPNVSYFLNPIFSFDVLNTFVFRNPSLGDIYLGINAFEKWYEYQDMNIILPEAVKNYEESLKEYNSNRKEGLFDLTNKLKDVVEDIFISKIFSIDILSMPLKPFPKKLTKRTRTYELLNFVKNHNISEKILMPYMKLLLNDVTPPIIKFIESNNIDYVAFVPPTVKRKVQIMNEVREDILIKLPNIKECLIVKEYKNEIKLEQKTIRNKRDRVINAKETFFIKSNKKCETLLLIDDLSGSGSTINEIAKKIKTQGIAKEIIAITFVGAISKNFPVEKTA